MKRFLGYLVPGSAAAASDSCENGGGTAKRRLPPATSLCAFGTAGVCVHCGFGSVFPGNMSEEPKKSKGPRDLCVSRARVCDFAGEVGESISVSQP